MSLKQEEHEALVITGELAEAFAKIVSNGRTREQDLTEFTYHLHAIQNMVLAQSAGREYPDRYRLLGKTL